MDNLVTHYDAYLTNKSRFHPIAVAAWLHHRFTQIHPFEDGNGRVARALLTWHLARYQYLPVVISRDDKADYLETLEKADAGNLKPFIRFLVGLERQIIVEALREDTTEIASPVFSQVLEHVAQLAEQQVESEQAELRKVDQVALRLRDSAKKFLDDRSQEISKRLADSNFEVYAATEWGGPDNYKEHWYYSQIVQTANQVQVKHWVNFNESRYFAKLSVNPQAPSNAPRLVFVISLHHLGRQLTGVMAATAFAQIFRNDEPESDREEEANTVDFKNCSSELLTFTAADRVEDVSDSIR